MLDKLPEFISNHYILTTSFVVLLGLFFANESRRGGRNLSSRELTALVNAGTAVLVDVRPHKEYSAGHITGALNIPVDKFDSRMVELEKHKALTIVIIDANGTHAGTLCAQLQKAGFQAVRLAGGMLTWRGDNLPVVK